MQETYVDSSLIELYNNKICLSKGNLTGRIAERRVTCHTSGHLGAWPDLTFIPVSLLVFVFFLRLGHLFRRVSTGGLGLRTAGRGLSLCDVTNLSPAAYRKFSHGDARSSTPAPSRKRSCTMVVDYKEPTLNA